MRLDSKILLCALVVCLAPACSADESADADPHIDGVPGQDASIAFVQQGTLALVPGQTADIAVIGTPPAHYAVSFILVGEALDASLAQTNVVADADGVAIGRLRAPNTATNFVVRAKIKDGPSADLSVAVSDQGFGSLAIEPVYPGVRDPREWIASAVSGTTCAALSTSFPNDPEGALKAVAEPADPLVIEVAPVGPNIAVFVRGGHFMWGCSDEPNLVAGGTSKVKVPISDAPIDYSEAVLDMEMAFAPEPTGWNELLEAQRALMWNAFFNGNPSAPAAQLLDAMEGLSCNPQQFAANATSYDWLSEVQNHLASGAIDIALTLDTFADAGIAAEPPTILGAVTATVGEPGFATFSLASLGSATPDVMFVATDYQVNIDVDTADTARVGGKLFWMPSRYIGNAIANAGMAEYPATGSFVEVLAEVVQCEQLALSNPVGCDVMGTLCQQALAYLWEGALDVSASVGNYGAIDFEASGLSTFDDWAHLTGFDGAWIGQAITGTYKATVQGAVSAAKPERQLP